MWLSVPLPSLDCAQAVGRLVRCHVAVGSRLEPGDVLADVRIDLSAGIVRDCPPVTTCRIIMREAAWLRAIPIPTTEDVAAPAAVALLSTDPSSPAGTPGRQARVTVVAIIDHQDWWTAAE